jgi:Tol biopolymer transport system component
MQPSRPSTLVAIAMLALSSAACSSAGSEPEGGGAPPSTTASPELTTSVDEAVSTDDLTILFQRSGTGRTLVAGVARDGSGATATLPDFGEGNQTNPDWSPDGTHIVFAMVDGTTEDLFVARAGDADALTLLDCVSPCLYLDDPAWSPDGERIVFSRTVDRDGTAVSTLETVEVATGRVQVLLGPWTRQLIAGARWSPDGRRIVIEMVSRTGPGLDADLSGVTLSVLRLDRADHTVQSVTDPALLATTGLTDPSLFAGTADWSPDGRWIVYSALAAPEDEAADLFLVRARGGAPRRLTSLVDVGGEAAHPTFTPDGGTIVFSGRRSPADADPLLLQVDLDGTGLALATGDAEVAGEHPRVR